MSGQQYYPGSTPLTPGKPGTLASDADRDRAVDVLNAAFAVGRLTAAEHGERLHAAYAARTWPQLRQLAADLPTGDRATAPQAAVAGPATDLDRCLLCLLLITCPPAGIAWLVLSWRHSRGRARRALAAAAGRENVDAAWAGRRALWQETGHAPDC